MSDSAAAEMQTPRSKSKMRLLIWVVLFVAGVVGGFLVAQSGAIPVHLSGPGSQDHPTEEAVDVPEMPDIVFVPIPTMTVTLPPDAAYSHLRFSAQIETKEEYAHDVEKLMPRIQDFLNGYLRALEARDVEGPGALLKLRAQMLRRVIVVVGKGRASNLLVTEFILS